MSQRFALDKCPKGLAFLIRADDSNKFQKLCADARLQASIPPRRKALKSWRTKDEGDKAVSSSLSFPKRLERSSFKSENANFRKIEQTNVFIDSYYPKLVADFSEDCSRKSLSSRGEIPSLQTVDSSESDFRRTYDAVRRTCDRDNPEFVRVIFKDRKSRRSDWATLQKSSRSRLTLNCNTYTLISISSDLESFVSRNNPNSNHEGVTKAKASSCCLLDERREFTEDEPEAWPKEEKTINLRKLAKESRDALSATDCFAHLYKRIETLEKMLQQTLANSVQPKECKCTESPENWQKSQSKKNHLALPKSSELKNHSASTARVLEVSSRTSRTRTTEGNENSDTESELRKIKKRLSALERRFREAKNSADCHSEDTKPPTVNNESTLNVVEVKSNDRHGTTTLDKSKESDFAGPLLSQATFVVPDKVFILRANSETKIDKLSANVIGDRVKIKKTSKCKRIKRKNSSIFNSKKKAFRSRKPSLKINERSKVSHVQSLITEKTSDSPFSSFFHEGKHQRQRMLASHPVKPRKKYKNKLHSLCRKSSITNIVLARGEQIQRKDEAEITSASGGKSERPTDFERTRASTPEWPPCSCWMTFSARYPQTPSRKSVIRKIIHGNCEVGKTEPSKAEPPLLDPIEILKGGGKIKIPVLFEEVCKTSKSKAPGRNFSDISMRFVLVQEDPKHPLKKMIKKLSQGKWTEKMEHYLFGVSKCSCDGQVVPPIQ